MLAHKHSSAAKRAIAKFVKIEDAKILDASYDAYIPYLEMNLDLRDEVIRAELNYLDGKEFPKARSANVTEFYDNSLVEALEKSGFFASIGFGSPK